MSEAMHRRAGLFDPHPLLLGALESILSSIEVKVGGKGTAPERALDLVEETQPDILICESDTGSGMSGGALVRASLERISTLRVIVLGASRDRVDIDEAFDAGALAYAM